MARNVPILQIVGYQNSGKTTFVERLLEKLESLGVKAGCLKHHGHGGEPDLIGEGKDSARFLLAGAAASGVEGDGVFQFTARGGWTLEKLIAVYGLLSIDCLLIEGFKQASYPKIVMVRNEEDHQLVEQLDGVLAVIYQRGKPPVTTPDIKSFHIEDPGAVSFILQHLKEEGVCLNDLM
ncbi:molybdopterin-guanine dinucleotide biosynthesis protein B [Bacillus sonorensis]|uniref:Molybdopterin-guanine dinucleotide biosynthesis protein B n=2 Tax=Bacillus sonorensis TaxID=119858 RepID=M5P4Z4_9BACI|nr:MULTISPECIES: molybdopterin-guanine dinucleotide biosynthesis protein B [Bacillus]TWK71789.1 Molybdopterin-guanine dinucleotide biosynthesis adapter protein [Bacillus paralicheniformis]ASB89817.1 putative molybdopterin-guanine dinucleotide biosynthesis adapter protein [Bacillus sonorensis]EME74494.1 molybdopterin-guanine dinucleotide biosynthesis protein B [Bacillus sonorensis L12]MBG9916940.1 molybdopterin-guanine dinucleotide biosynthesis protein B [Bacillus sonorensis]MCF7619070.1 molybd